MNILEKFKNLTDIKKLLILGGLFLFVNPLFFLFLAFYFYKSVRGNTKFVVSGILLVLALFSYSFLINSWNGDNTKEADKPKPTPVVTVETKPASSSTLIPTLVEKDESKTTFKVLSVTDGDTIRIDYFGKSEPVRFIGIDSPEINSSSEPVMCYGPQAKKYLEDNLLNKMVKIERDPKDTDRDKYDRLLRYIYLEDGTNFVEQEIKQGYALEYTYNKEYKYQTLFKQAQEYAKTTKVGLWADTTCKGSVYTGTYKDPNFKPTIIPTVQTQTNTYIAPQQDTSTTSWACNCKKTCPDMSCAEAQFQLKTCGCSARDNDHDGLACNSQCQ